VIGIGESGLDFHYDRSDRDRQRASFRSHIAAARESGLPLIVHTRDAEADTAAILAEEMGKGAYTGVIHCFTASAAFADRALELGCTISMSGIVTFKNARDLAAVAATVPADKLLIETDSPFLAPVPHRASHASLPSSPTPRASWQRCEGRALRNWRGPPATISAPCSARAA
jgi:TatD DNase family protein